MTSNVSKLRIGVFMGGKSIEREVSFNSGRTICDHLDTTIFEAVPLFQTEQGDVYLLPWHFLHRGKIADFRSRLETEATQLSWDDLKKLVDFVYIAVHGRYAEDGTLQGMLEVLGIPYLGARVFASAASMDKAFHKQVLSAAGVKVPRGIVIKKKEVSGVTTQNILDRLKLVQVDFPCIVKPSHEGSSLGVSVVHSEEELLSALTKAYSVDDEKFQDVIVEEKINGMEFVCVLLQDMSGSWLSLPLTEVRIEEGSEIFDYDQKYMPGRATKTTPARCSEHVRQAIVETSQRTAKALDITTVARIDGIVSKNGDVVIIDPNTLTGMAPATFLFTQAAEYGMSHTQLINYLIKRDLIKAGLMVEGLENSKKGTMDIQKKMSVGVMFGGDSNEREISLESGRNICYKLSPYKYEVTPLFVNDRMELFRLSSKLLIKNSTREIAQLVTPDMHVKWSELPKAFDFIFLGLHGGKGENGSVQGALEMLGMPYNGSGVLASALCMNKFRANTFLRSQGFDVPRSVLIEKKEWIELGFSHESLTAFIQEVSFPLIVKPHDDGCSVLVEKAVDRASLELLITQMFAHGKEYVLLEELIAGMELTCGIYGNDNPIALPPSQTVTQHDILTIEEKFLPGAGHNLTPAPLSASGMVLVQETLKKAYALIGCKGYSRIDCFYQTAVQSSTGKERVIILEFNTLPALTPATCLFHQAAEVGIKPMEFIDILVELGFQNHACKEEAAIKNVHIGDSV